MSFISFKYLDSNSVSVSGARNTKNAHSQYLRSTDGIPFNIAPYILPFDCFLTVITARSVDTNTWTVKIRSNGVDVIGAELSVINDTVAVGTYAIQLLKGQPIEIYLETSTPVDNPSVNIVLQKNI